MFENWTNTGSNGQATAEWHRRADGFAVEIRVMPYRCLVTLWKGTLASLEGEPFNDLPSAQAFGDAWLAGR